MARYTQDQIRQMRDGIIRFAWLPVRLENLKCIWLKKYVSFYHIGKDFNGNLYIWSSSRDTFVPMKSNYLPQDAVVLKLRG